MGENKDGNSNTTDKETIKETVTDSKFVMGAGTGFVAGALTGGLLTHAYDKKKQNMEEKKCMKEEKERQRILELRRAREREELERERWEYNCRRREEREYREGYYEEERRGRGRRGRSRRHSRRGIHPAAAALGGFVAGEMIGGGGKRIGDMLCGGGGGFERRGSGLW